ncbi:MAG: monofunctional biosynthetic peptidoglycan transglycosylase [Burkholderiaceae bacterium]|nr:monofunctional biosynthetic peptidoglycan transglycosylase [Burkholderiaceae bacterium]
MARSRLGWRRALHAIGWTLLLAFTALLALQLWYFAHILWWNHFDPGSTRFMRQQLSHLRVDDPKRQLEHRWVPYARISPHLKRAVIAAEDANFTEHDGVDWDAIERAYEQNRRRGRVVRGGSTITMQLAKNLFLSGNRSYLRKGQELVITYMIETVMSKRRILELYLNVAEWGVGVFGAEAGARHYFGVPAAQLAPGQAARMAAMLPRPRYYDAHRGSPALARRAAIVARWMGAIDPP